MSKSQRSFEGRFENLAKIGEFIEEITAKAGLDEKQRYAVQMAVDEAASNIIEHAYRNVEDGKIDMTVEHSPKKLALQTALQIYEMVSLNLWTVGDTNGKSSKTARKFLLALRSENRVLKN